MHQNNQPGINRKGWILIIAGWSITQLILLAMYGIDDQQEAVKYIDLARDVVNGSNIFTLHHIWYTGYIALHVLIRLLGLAPKCMYGLQLIASFISLIYFVRIVAIWTGSRLTLVLSGLLYSTCFIVQQWVGHLFTDSIFASLLIVSIYYLLEERRSTAHRVAFWCLFVLLPFFRPVGPLFIAVACVHWICNFPRRNLWKLAGATVYLLFLLMLGRRTADTEAFYPFHNLEANVICSIPSGLLKYQVAPYHEGEGVAAFLWSNPGMTIRLFLYRFYKVFSLTRPFFSAYHNLAIAATSLVYYLLALVGICFIVIKKHRDQLFLIAGALFFSVPSVIFCVEWHGRMSLPVICFVLLMAAWGLDQIIKKTKTIWLSRKWSSSFKGCSVSEGLT